MPKRIRPVLKQLFLETFQYKHSLRYQTINLLWSVSKKSLSIPYELEVLLPICY